MKASQTPSQTVGPFFHYGLIFGGEDELVRIGARGKHILLLGHVFDGNRTALPDVMIEIWQADAQGIYPHPADPRYTDADPCFKGFGRSDTTQDSDYRFSTIKPGMVPASKPNIPQAPHINVRIFGRGLLTHLQTRFYFADEEAANERDPFFQSLDPLRRETLLAKPVNHCGDTPVYRRDIVLQGDNETLFFHP